MWSFSTLFSSSLLISSLPAVFATAVPSSSATASASISSTNNANSSNSTVEMVASAWFAGWHATEGFAVSNVSWEKYTHMTYSFATTGPDVHNLSLAASDEEILPTFVSAAHQNGVKALLSIGGWTGSLYYSANVASAENRTAFVKTVTDLATQYNLDGIDFE
ncbi:hypothetical protein NM688_g4674 [Phlebia brevispora]|uniref:Uncharacterized protein n=1 Tax=Phlebia brevispora TaxID=194682 RepID=A0ACC1T2G6_9APHY|nr:hypothetical protein NM688_g4674 [Phlebia brevispora]